MSHTDMGIVGATTDTFILFENGVRRNLSLSETLSGWRLTEAMLLFKEDLFRLIGWAVKHGGFSAIPPSTVLHSERRILATKCALISPKCHSRLAASGAKRSL
jgi:hypothetical protein